MMSMEFAVQLRGRASLPLCFLPLFSSAAGGKKVNVPSITCIGAFCNGSSQCSFAWPSLTQLSDLWLEMVPFEARYRTEPAVFRYVLRVYLGLTLSGDPSLATCKSYDCLKVAGTLGSH